MPLKLLKFRLFFHFQITFIFSHFLKKKKKNIKTKKDELNQI